MVVAAADDDVGAETLNGQGVGGMGLVAETLVEIFDGCLAGDLEGHDVGEMMGGVFAIEFFGAVDGYHAVCRALVDERDVFVEEFAEDGIDLVAVEIAVGIFVPDVHGLEGGVGGKPGLGGKCGNGDSSFGVVDRNV